MDIEQEFAQGCIKAVLDQYVDPLLSSIKKKSQSGWNKFKIDFDLSFRAYLKKADEKYSRVKTILYKSEPQPLYDFFEVPYLEKDRENKIYADCVDSVIDVSHYCIISGTGGIGKTTLLKHLFINAIRSKIFIPVFLELKDLNSYDGPYELVDFIFSRVENLDFKVHREYLDYALQSGRFVFFLDGYDELLTEKRDLFTRKLEDFCDRYSSNYYIMASRPFSDFVFLQRFSVLEVLPFELEQAVSLIKKIKFDADVKNRFISELEDGLFEEHESFASNPLLLTIMLLTFENYADIPEKLHIFYANAFETLYDKHDATKAGFKREKKCKLSFDEFRNVFSKFCFITYFEGILEFSRDYIIKKLGLIAEKRIVFDAEAFLDDLVNSLCILVKDGQSYRFTHRSFQEYYTAFFLKENSDDNMSRLSLALIRKDTLRAAHDSVFSMLYDMAEDRFEQHVLLPALTEAQKGLKDESLYDLYFRIIVSSIFVLRERINEPAEVLLGQSIDSPHLGEFFLGVSEIYQRKNQIVIDITDGADDLLAYIEKKHDNRIGHGVEQNEIVSDPICYNLVKKTWIGKTVELISNLKTLLEAKSQNANNSLYELLGLI